MSDESSRLEHPEADLLAGFAENSLTQHEQEGVLSHLAVCARCRQIAFLAHQIEPTANTQISELEERPFWRRKWSPLVALAGALALVVITFLSYGQFHKLANPPAREVAQQREPQATSNEGASEAAAPAAVPPVPADKHYGKSAAKRTRADSTPQQAAAPPSPLAALNSAGASGDEAHTLTEDGPQAAVRRYQTERRLNSASKKQAADVVRSDGSSNPGTQDHAGVSARAVQSAKVNPQNGNTWAQPPASSGASGSSQAYRQELSTPAVESNPALESGEVHAEGCVEQGVEAGCLMVKDRQSGRLYHILIKGARPQLRDGIEFTGVPHDGPTICMQGIPLDVITWAEKSSLKCSRGSATKK